MAKPWIALGRYGGVGLEFVLTILIPAAFGEWLDGRYWGHRGWGGGVGFVIGVAVAFRNLVRTARGMQKDIERAESMDPDASRWTVDEAWLHKDTDSMAAPRDPEAPPPPSPPGDRDPR